METTCIDTAVWEPDPTHPGTVRRVRTKTVREVFEAIRERFWAKDDDGYYIEPVGCNEYLSVTSAIETWPNGRTMVYVVTGASEGHYIHIGVDGADGTQYTCVLGKTFDGWDNAWAFAKRVAEALNV